MALTEIQIKKLKPSVKIAKHFDSGGLYLEVPVSGNKRWRLKYRYHGKEQLLSLGLYPIVTLKSARDRRDEARKLLANGVNPSDQRKSQKASLTELEENKFETVAIEWMNKQKNIWSESHSKIVSQRLVNNVFPFIGKTNITNISVPDLLQILRRIESRDALETAHRVRGIFGQIFRYGIATGRIGSDPSRDLRGALAAVKKEHLASVTNPDEIADLLKMFDAYKGSPIVSSALKLAPLVFVRPGELRHAEWEHIDFNAAEWRFIVSKTSSQHIVPLSQQAVKILREIHVLTSGSRYVFPSARTFQRPMSNNAILAAMRSLGISKEKMCGHGFRAMARTLLDEELKFPVHLIEHQLAHSVKDPLGRAYNRTQHLQERKIMMQRWADYLDTLKGD